MATLVKTEHVYQTHAQDKSFGMVTGLKTHVVMDCAGTAQYLGAR